MVGTHTWNVIIQPDVWWTASPSSLDFGIFPYRAGTPNCSSSQGITITNAKSTAISITATINVLDYKFFGWNIGQPATITVPANGTNTLAVSFCPSAAGSRPGTITITCTTTGCAPSPGPVITLTGIGGVCTGAIDANSTVYRQDTDSVVGGSSDNQIITMKIKNTGNVAGVVFWKYYWSKDGVTWTGDVNGGTWDGTHPGWASGGGYCEESVSNCYGNPNITIPAGGLSTQFITLGMAPDYTWPTDHKWHLGLKVWGESETEPSTLSLTLGQGLDTKSIILGLAVVGGIAGLLWWTKQKKMW